MYRRPSKERARANRSERLRRWLRAPNEGAAAACTWFEPLAQFERDADEGGASAARCARLPTRYAATPLFLLLNSDRSATRRVFKHTHTQPRVCQISPRVVSHTRERALCVCLCVSFFLSSKERERERENKRALSLFRQEQRLHSRARVFFPRFERAAVETQRLARAARACRQSAARRVAGRPARAPRRSRAWRDSPRQRLSLSLLLLVLVLLLLLVLLLVPLMMRVCARVCGFPLWWRVWSSLAERRGRAFVPGLCSFGRRAYRRSAALALVERAAAAARHALAQIPRRRAPRKRAVTHTTTARRVSLSRVSKESTRPPDL